MSETHNLCKQCGGRPREHSNGNTFYIKCQSCQQRTQDHPTAAAAWEEWNRLNAPST